MWDVSWPYLNCQSWPWELRRRTRRNHMQHCSNRHLAPWRHTCTHVHNHIYLYIGLYIAVRSEPKIINGWTQDNASCSSWGDKKPEAATAGDRWRGRGAVDNGRTLTDELLTACWQWSLCSLASTRRVCSCRSTQLTSSPTYDSDSTRLDLSLNPPPPPPDVIASPASDACSRAVISAIVESCCCQRYDSTWEVC